MEEKPGPAERRLAALRSLVQRAQQTFLRFPFVILGAVAAALAAHVLASIGFEAHRGAHALYPIFMTGVLAISVLYSVRMLGEGRGAGRRTQLGLGLATLVALVGYYLVLPETIRGADITNYLLLLAAGHLAASSAPHLFRHGEENGFWQYNKVLFLRFAAGTLHSAVLYIGLALALAACETLLGLDLPAEVYAQLFFWIALVYNTWFFLAGVPERLDDLQTTSDYPTALRVFSQYVLIPLVVIYLAILYAYCVKIIVGWELPKGWVGYPIIGVSVTGLLALLLVHPIRRRAGNAWILNYSRYFYLSLVPLLGLLAVAIGTRISAYGVTEKRYLVVAAGVWLLATALYFSIRRQSDIRIVPISLCAVTLFSIFGPWSATAVSRRSQLNELRRLLDREGVVVAGAMTAGPKRMPVETERRITNIVRYLHDMHGLSHLRDWYADAEALPENASAEEALRAMGLRYVGPGQSGRRSFGVDAPAPNPLVARDFDYVYRVSERFSDPPASFVAALDEETELWLEDTTLRIGRRGEPDSWLELKLLPLIGELRRIAEGGPDTAGEAVSVERENDDYRALLYLTGADGTEDDAGAIRLNRLQATVLVELRRP